MVLTQPCRKLSMNPNLPSSPVCYEFMYIHLVLSIRTVFTERFVGLFLSVFVSLCIYSFVHLIIRGFVPLSNNTVTKRIREINDDMLVKLNEFFIENEL
jgi:hypothetical protein